MAKCDLCGKGPRFGYNVPKSKHRTKRQWKPNIQRVTVLVNGVPRRLNVCAKCLRTLYKTRGR